MVSKTPATIRMTKPSAPISFKSIIKGSKDHSKGTIMATEIIGAAVLHRLSCLDTSRPWVSFGGHLDDKGKAATKPER